MNSLPINIDITSENFIRGRLSLTPGGGNLAMLKLLPASASERLEIGDKLCLDFSDTIFDASREPEKMPSGWRWERAGSKIEVTAEAALVLPAEVKIPLPAPLIEQFRKSYGPLTITVKRGAEVRGELRTGQTVLLKGAANAAPPVVAAWQDGGAPVLAIGQPATLTLTIANARRNSKGEPKDLVTADRGQLRARVRLAFAPRYEDGKALAIADAHTLQPVEPAVETVLPAGSGAKVFAWSVIDRSDNWELEADIHNHSLIPAGAMLRVSLAKVTATRAGVYPLCVSLIDFPGYVGTTYHLPVLVAPPAISDFVIVPNHMTGPGFVQVFWRVQNADGLSQELTISPDGGAVIEKPISPGMVTRGQGEYRAEVKTTTSFALSLKSSAREIVKRQATVFVI